MATHLRSDKHGRKSNWVKSLQRLGLKPVMEIVEEIEDETDALWQEAERCFCAFFRSTGATLLNHDEGGNQGKRMDEETKAKLRIASTGRRHSPEVIERMRAIKIASVTPELRERMGALWRGKKTPRELVERRAKAQTGMKRSPEFVEAQRQRGLGRKHKEESKEKNREWHLGKKHTPEARANMGAARLGKKRGPYKPGTGENISRALKGKKHTPEARLKRSLSMRGKKRGPYKKSGKKRGPMSEASKQLMRDAWARRKGLTQLPTT